MGIPTSETKKPPRVGGWERFRASCCEPQNFEQPDNDRRRYSMNLDPDRVTAGFQTLFDQSKDSAESYLRRAKGDIDEMFGDGYAAKHPELVAAYMQTACRDFTASSMMKVLGSALDNIAASIRELRPED
jgi:hypothetical protein